jgi:hypothetical protein
LYHSPKQSNTIGFVLYNLARLPDFQRDLRVEIQRAGPPDEVNYEKMPLLNAIINVRSLPISSVFMTQVVDFVTMTCRKSCACTQASLSLTWSQPQTACCHLVNRSQ